MLALIAWLVSIVAVFAALPALFLLVEVLLALVARPRTRDPRAEANYVVIVPAHDEEDGLAATLDSLSRSIDSRGYILVVADNCTDSTADIAREASVKVIERVDASRRGKGFALSHAVRSLEASPPDVLVFVDADCLVEPDAIGALVNTAVATGSPAQADYVLIDHDRTPRSALSTLAFLIRNRVRPRGLAVLGGPSGLFGTGMAIPYGLFRSLPDTEGHLVEDMSLGVEAALRGSAPILVADAHVTSAAAKPTATEAQRTRWEHGHLGVLRRDVPRLLRSGDGRALLLGLDLAIPPLSLLVLTNLALAALGVLIALVIGSKTTLIVAAGSLATISLAIFLAWSRFGREIVPVSALLEIPAYLLFKIPIYLRLMKNGPKAWIRTARGRHE